MTVVYTYFRYIADKEKHRALIYYLSGLTNVPIIFETPSGADWAMGNTGAQAKEPANDAQTSQEHQGEGLGKLYIGPLKEFKEKSCCTTFLKILFVILCLITIFKSIAVIIVTVTSAIATKIFNTDQSGRLVAMIILAVTAAITLTVTIYAMIAVFRKQKRPLHAAAVVLIILAIIQALIAGISVKVSAEDEVQLSKSLGDSFRLALDDNPRHVKLWASIQSDLTCCGVYSAEDYRTPNLPPYFSPDVPISCCPGYDRDRSELVQERERQSCKARKEYYDVGCRNIIIELFTNTSTMVLSVVIVLIILEVVKSVIGAILSRQTEQYENEVVIVEDGQGNGNNKNKSKS